eukprot:scaffold1503_cov150-Ochromonas_danica.AAC.7
MSFNAFCGAASRGNAFALLLASYTTSQGLAHCGGGGGGGHSATTRPLLLLLLPLALDEDYLDYLG